MSQFQLPNEFKFWNQAQTFSMRLVFSRVARLITKFDFSHASVRGFEETSISSVSTLISYRCTKTALYFFVIKIRHLIFLLNLHPSSFHTMDWFSGNINTHFYQVFFDCWRKSGPYLSYTHFTASPLAWDSYPSASSQSEVDFLSILSREFQLACGNSKTIWGSSWLALVIPAQPGSLWEVPCPFMNGHKSFYSWLCVLIAPLAWTVPKQCFKNIRPYHVAFLAAVSVLFYCRIWRLTTRRRWSRVFTR